MNNQEATLTNQIIALINENTSDITSINTILNSVSLHFTPPSSSLSDTHSDTTVYNQLLLPVNNQKRKVGRLSLVGCGPGSPSHLTIHALQILSSATLLIIDTLIPISKFYSLYPHLKSIPTHFARKFKGCANASQNEINDWIVDGLRRGEHVVRFKGGDSFVFGRGGEEIMFVKRFFRVVDWKDDKQEEEDEGVVKVEIVPGLSSSLSAPALAGISTTHRGIADQVFISTGHTLKQSTPTDTPIFPTYPSYNPKCTVILLMAMTNLRALVEHLQSDLGFPGGIPCAVIVKASWEDERVLKGNLDGMCEIVEREGVVNHATFVVGWVCGLELF